MKLGVRRGHGGQWGMEAGVPVAEGPRAVGAQGGVLGAQGPPRRRTEGRSVCVLSGPPSEPTAPSPATRPFLNASRMAACALDSELVSLVQ